MGGMILREGQKQPKLPVNYIVQINSQAKLIQNPKGLFDRPEIDANIRLGAIDIAIEQTQLQQIILMAEFFSKFQQRLFIEQHHKPKLPEGALREQEQRFQELYTQVYQNSKEKENPEDALSGQNKEDYEKAVINLPLDLIQIHVKNIIKKTERERQLQEIEEQKNKKTGVMGWFGFGKKAQQPGKESLVTEEDQNMLDKLLESTFSDTPEVTRPADYVWFTLGFLLEGGLVNLSKLQQNGDVDGAEFIYKKLEGTVRLRDVNQQFNIVLGEIRLDMMTTYAGSPNPIRTNFLARNALAPNPKPQFLSFGFEGKPLNQPHIDKVINLDIDSCQIT